MKAFVNGVEKRVIHFCNSINVSRSFRVDDRRNQAKSMRFQVKIRVDRKENKMATLVRAKIFCLFAFVETKTDTFKNTLVWLGFVLPLSINGC